MHERGHIGGPVMLVAGTYEGTGSPARLRLLGLIESA